MCLRCSIRRTLVARSTLSIWNLRLPSRQPTVRRLIGYLNDVGYVSVHLYSLHYDQDQLPVVFKRAIYVASARRNHFIRVTK